MKRLLIPTPRYERDLKKCLKKHPGLRDHFQSVLAMLSEDPAHPQLGVHKLKGRYAGLLACSAGYDLRVLFEFTAHDEAEAILLHAIGTHDQVY